MSSYRPGALFKRLRGGTTHEEAAPSANSGPVSKYASLGRKARVKASGGSGTSSDPSQQGSGEANGGGSGSGSGARRGGVVGLAAMAPGMAIGVGRPVLRNELLVALERKDTEEALRLLRSDEVAATAPLEGMGPGRMNGFAPVHVAAFFGDDAVLAYLLDEALAPPDAVTPRGETALDLAAKLNHVECVNILNTKLLEAGTAQVTVCFGFDVMR